MSRRRHDLGFDRKLRLEISGVVILSPCLFDLYQKSLYMQWTIVMKNTSRSVVEFWDAKNNGTKLCPNQYIRLYPGKKCPISEPEDSARSPSWTACHPGLQKWVRSQQPETVAASSHCVISVYP